jgi:GWxTD domain-containing protein
LEIEFDLKPGDYNLIFEFFDRETREPQRQDLKVNIPSMINSDILISGPILLDTIIVNEEGVLTLWPSFSSDMFSGLKALWVYFEVFCKKYPADLEINYHLLDSHGEERITGNFSRHIEAPVLRDRFALDIKEFTFDNYQLVLAINNGDKSAQAKRNFRVHSPGLPPSIQNLDEAIDQLIYIATERDIVRLKESFHGRRVEMFIKFWNKWAGDEAEGYKMMDEYYRRGTEADQLFNEGGWKCDRGHVYMIYGPPSEIDRHPYDIYGKAYEIWYYLEENKKFLFVDEGGFGDYRLKSPLWGY